MSVMKKQLVRATLGVVLAGACMMPAVAQDAKIGYINLQYVMENAPQTKEVLLALQEEFAPRERELIAKGKELEEFSAKTQKDAAVMGEVERNSAEKEFRSLQRDFQRLRQEYEEDVNLRRNEELGELQRSLITEVREYAQSQGFDLIISDGVLFASTAINITEGALAAVSASQQANAQ